jgi:hypothetical protein
MGDVPQGKTAFIGQIHRNEKIKNYLSGRKEDDPIHSHEDRKKARPTAYLIQPPLEFIDHTSLFFAYCGPTHLLARTCCYERGKVGGAMYATGLRSGAMMSTVLFERDPHTITPQEFSLNVD